MSNPYLDILSGRRGSRYKIASQASACPMGKSSVQILQGTVDVPSVPGVRMKPGVALTPTISSFLVVLRQIWPLPNVPIVISQGLRTAKNQATVMLSNFKRKGGGAPGDYPYAKDRLQGYPRGVRYLYGLYGNKSSIQSLLKVPQDVESWTAIIQGFANRGILISDHMSGSAVDIRCWNMTREDQVRVATAIESSIPGTKVVIEDDHIHVEGLKPVEGGAMVVAPSVVAELPDATPDIVAEPAADTLAWWARFWNPKRDAIAKVVKADPQIVTDTLKWAVPTAAAVIVLGVGLSGLRRRGSYAQQEIL
jgi:hypothetical protein